MKKALSIVLALLVALSMFSVVAFATAGETTGTEELITVIFQRDDGSHYYSVELKYGEELNPYLKEMEYPVKDDTETTRYTFDGWKLEGTDGPAYYNNTISLYEDGFNLKAGDTITFVATYVEEDISGRQSFWNFIESLFERLNILFEYFATIFNF